MHMITPLKVGCPWSTWARPNVKWCEHNLCAFVTTPANTWSNMLYCFFAWVMWKEAKGRRHLQLFAVASMMVGVTSFAYHASYTKFFQFFDFVGMFCFCMASITLNARRNGYCQKHRVMHFYTIGVGLCTAAFLMIATLSLPVQVTVVALIAITGGQEYRLQTSAIYAQNPHMRPSMQHFYSAFVLLFVAFGCSMADLTRVWCNPDNHVMNGHSMWHILTSIVLYLLFKYHKQFAYDDKNDRAQGLRPIKVQTV